MITINRIFAWGSTFFMGKDGYVYACGRNEYGQLGNNTNTHLSYPEQQGLKNIKKVCIGEYHTIFITTDGIAYATGDNSYGQLGVGSNEKYITTPRQVLLESIDDATFMGCYTLFKQKTGVYAVAGASPSERLVRDRPVVVDKLGELITNDKNSFITTENGIQTMGANLYGELANMTLDPSTSLTTIPEYLGMNHIIDVAVGGEHIVFLSEEGSVFTVGSNDKHQLGYLSPKDKMSTPAILDLLDIIAISAGYEHTLFLDKNGILYGCGSNQNGQLGLGDTEYAETPVQLMEDVMYMKCGEFNSFVVKKSGVIYVTGYNHYGNLANGSTTDIAYFTPLTDYVFDTTLTDLITPPDVHVQYEKGNIKHIIEVQYTHIGPGNVRVVCYINTESLERKVKHGQEQVLTFNTNTLSTMESTCAIVADSLIKSAKQYINDNTIYHRDPVYVTKTYIYLNNGEILVRDGGLSEMQSKQVATDYIREKYRIETHTIQYYNSSDFKDLDIIGEPTWVPTKGSSKLIINELDRSNYNYY